MDIGNYVVISAVICATILTVTNGLKELLESPILNWLLKLLGHEEVKPYISVAITIITAISAGIVAYGQDGLTITEIISIISGWLGSLGTFRMVKNAGSRVTE